MNSQSPTNPFSPQNKIYSPQSKIHSPQNKMYVPPQQYKYIQQIYHQYVQGHDTNLVRRMFQTLHSDWLNLTIKPQKHTPNLQILTAQTQYKKGDIILEIRGSIINKLKLQQLIKQKPQTLNFMNRVNCLLFGEERNQVLVPKGMSKVLLRNQPVYMEFIKENQGRANCMIQLQSGSKYLVSAQKQIDAGEPLILNLKSLERHVYDFQRY